MHHLQAEHMAVALQLSEPWLREYQVLTVPNVGVVAGFTLQPLPCLV